MRNAIVIESPYHVEKCIGCSCKIEQFGCETLITLLCST